METCDSYKFQAMIRSEKVAFSERDTAIEDFEVVLEVLGGNQEAYAQLVRKHESRVRAHCLGMLGNLTQAEDAAQEVFIKAYQGLASFKGNAKFSTWLYRITHFHCLDLLKSSSRKKTESWDALLDSKGEKAESYLGDHAPELPMNDSESAEALAKILSRLPEKSRVMITLREIHGLSYDEISETLTCTLDAVKSRLRRARQELAQIVRHLDKSSVV